MKLNLGCGKHRIAGFDNLDAHVTPAWRFEDGLGAYGDGSVEGITISHALMYLPLTAWPAAFAEFYRVLAPGGVLRITEDDAENPKSERYGGFRDAVTLTGPNVVRLHLREAGFRARLQKADTGADPSLFQAWHGEAPKCFWIEGRKT